MRIGSLIIVVILAIGAVALFQVGCDSGDTGPDPAATPAPDSQPEEVVHDGEQHVDMGEDRPIRGELTMKTPAKFGTFNPVTRQDGREKNILKYHLNLFLLTRHPEELTCIPWLAASLPNVSEDGLTHSWTIKEGARCSPRGRDRARIRPSLPNETE